MTRLRSVKGLSPMPCPRCKGYKLKQVDWVPVAYPIVGMDQDGAIVVGNAVGDATVEWEEFDRDRQEVWCFVCGHRYKLDDAQDVRVRGDDGY